MPLVYCHACAAQTGPGRPGPEGTLLCPLCSCEFTEVVEPPQPSAGAEASAAVYSFVFNQPYQQGQQGQQVQHQDATVVVFQATTT
jgi:hypothetical protein